MGASTSGSNGIGACSSYPYTLANYRSARTILTLDLLAGETTFQQLFGEAFHALLQGCRNRIDEAVNRASLCLSGALPSASDLRMRIDAILNVIDSSITLRLLMETPQNAWPADLPNRLRDLFDLGVYINAHMIPDSAKPALVDFFSDTGDRFLAKSGSLTLRDYFERPRSAYSPAELDLLYKGRRLGVLICHEQAALTTKSGQCWNGINCVSTTSHKSCNGDSGASDPC